MSDYTNDPTTREDEQMIDCPHCNGERGEMIFDHEIQQLIFEKCVHCEGEGIIVNPDIY
jgi:DnaJ-class molecular chaperone